MIGRLLCERFNQPIVLGELLLGLVLGNLALAQVTEPIGFIAHLGVLILLFSSGLALDFEEMRLLGKPTFSITTGGAILPLALGYLLGLLFGFSQLEALFIGTALVATSIGITAEILHEMKMLRTRLGTVIIGSAVVDDVYGILALGIVSSLALTGAIHLGEIAITLLLSFLFFALSLSIVRKVFGKIAKRFVLKPEDLLLFGLIVLLIYGLIAKEIGLELLVGAFLAGLILGQSHYSRDLLESVSIFGEAFFIPIFFVTVGMSLTLSSFFSQKMIVFTLALAGLAFLGKIVGSGLGALFSGFNRNESLIVGISMVPRGEVALVITSIGLAYGLSSSIASAVMVMIISTSILAPLLLTKQIKRLKKRGEKNESKRLL